MSSIESKLKPKWGSVPSRYYAAWQRELFAFHLWPPERCRLFIIAIACMERLMKITDVDELTFGFGNEKESTDFSFRLNNNKAVLEKDDIIDGDWVNIYRDLWSQVSDALSDNVENAFAIIAKVLMQGMPTIYINNYQLVLPGIEIGWESKNLTAPDILERILHSNKNNSAEE